jgi:hypothetical protein
MSQENSTPDESKETRKKILLGGLFVVLIGIVYYQFFYGNDDPPVNRAANASAVSTTSSPTPAPLPTPRPGRTDVPIVSQPLNLTSITNKGTPGDGTGRNIFVYPPPPTPVPTKPPPTPTPTPPPPVTLYSVNPATVIARTSDFNLTVLGEKIPEDGQVFVNGRNYQTTFVSAREVRAKVPAEAIRSSGNLGIQVRSTSDAKFFSNQLSLNVTEPPAPPYRYIGLYVTKKGSIAVLKAQSEENEVINVVKDQKFGTRWKVISITPQQVEVEDTNIKIKHVINFTGETG